MKKVFIKMVNFCRSVRFFVPIFNCVNPDPIWIHCTDYITVTNQLVYLWQGCMGDCSVLHPTLMCAVPLILDRIFKGIQENINKKGEEGEEKCNSVWVEVGCSTVDTRVYILHRK